jgi:hypothetical protein
VSPARARDSAAVSLRGWALEAEAAAGIARALAPTPFVPDSLRRWLNPQERDPAKRQLDMEGTVATVTAVLLAGQELEFGPMASLRAITIIKGTVALYAVACRAILQRNGHDIVVKESTDHRAIVDARRAGTDQWQRVTWDLDRAKVAGLYPGHQDGNWRKQPKAMLVARATAEASRWVASDAMLGLPMIVEEVEDAERGELLALPPGQADANGADPGQQAPEEPKRTAARRPRRPAAASLPPPPPDTTEPPAPPPAPSDVPPPEGPMISKPQRNRLYAGLRDIGIGARENREEALALLGAWIGRAVESTNDLTDAEAHTVLDRLAALRTLGARSPDDENPDPGPEEDPARDDDG